MPRAEDLPGRSSSAALLGLGATGAAAAHVGVGMATFARSQIEPAAGREWAAGLTCFAFEVAPHSPLGARSRAMTCSWSRR